MWINEKARATNALGLFPSNIYTERLLQPVEGDDDGTRHETQSVADGVSQHDSQLFGDELPAVEVDEDVAAAVVDGERVDHLLETDDVLDVVDVLLADDVEVAHGEAERLPAVLAVTPDMHRQAVLLVWTVPLENGGRTFYFRHDAPYVGWGVVK